MESVYVKSESSDIFEQVRLFLPKYLTEQQRRQLFSELSKFPDNVQFFIFRDDPREQLLQGDGWRGFIAIDFRTNTRKEVSGVVLSNSCDIASDNQRNFPVNILFAPLIELSKYEQLLVNAGKPSGEVAGIISNIKKQYVTSIFYVPPCPNSVAESIIVLDDLHAHPLQDFLGRERTSLFTLNQYAFYIFLIKLSIHFARFGEGIQRFEDAA